MGWTARRCHARWAYGRMWWRSEWRAARAWRTWRAWRAWRAWRTSAATDASAPAAGEREAVPGLSGGLAAPPSARQCRRRDAARRAGGADRDFRPPARRCAAAGAA